MSSSDVISRLVEAEASFPVNDWSACGFRLWPLLRARLAFEIILKPSRRRPSMRHKMQARGLGAVQTLARHTLATVRDAAGNASIAPADVLFLSDGFSFTRLDGRWYERFCDPLIARLHEGQRCSTLLLTPSANYFLPRHSPSVFIQPALDWAAARAQFASPPPATLPGYDAFREWAATRLQPASVPSAQEVARLCLRVRALARYFAGVLEQVRPRAAFAVSYYGTEGMAFNLACREARVLSVDLQHGIAGPLHFAYGAWTRVPPQGYELLPTVFWCWSAADAAAIAAWAKPGVPHRALVGGNPWLAEWQQAESPLARSYGARVKALFGPGKHVLVSLQFGLRDEESVLPAVEAMRRTAGECKWWFRLHPSMSAAERAATQARLAENGIPTSETQQASELPLYALLQHAAVHVTHSSSTVLEAESFGVPSVITSHYGSEVYPDAVRSGIAAVATEAAAIATAVRERLRQGRRAPAQNPNLVGVALEQIVTSSAADLPAVAHA